jgi:uncharacterized protein DUF4396
MKGEAPDRKPLNRLAFSATVHCLAGCSIGEILGMVIGTALHWDNGPTIAVSIALAFVFGYAFTVLPLRRGGLTLGTATRLALLADTLSITVMEIVDNAIMVVVPGAMDAGLAEGVFWGTLVASLLLAGVAAYPVNRWLIARGRGHALVHQHHGDARSSGTAHAPSAGQGRYHHGDRS